MKFIFKGKDSDGAVREGTVEAVNADAAAQILEKNGLVPISIKGEEKTPVFFRSIQKVWEGISQKDILVLFQQLAVLIEARVPIVSSLTTIGEQTNNKYLQVVLKEMRDDIEDGMSFSDALESHPDVFSILTIQMIRAGEASGELQKSIEIAAVSIERNYQLTAKIRGALYYPSFVLFVAFVIGFLVVTFILPKITIMIKDLNVPVPWYTSVLVWLGDFMNTYWWAVLIVLVGAAMGVVYYVRTEAGKREWEVLILKLPVIGVLVRNLYIARFSENLSALLDGGIPVVKALVIVSRVIGNQVFEKIILRAADEVKSGGTMSTVLIRSREMPPIVSQMVRIGEESGALAGVLKSAGKFYNQEVDNTTRNLTALIEPILIVLLGIGVGILVIGVLMPIYNIAGQL